MNEAKEKPPTQNATVYILTEHRMPEVSSHPAACILNFVHWHHLPNNDLLGTYYVTVFQRARNVAVDKAGLHSGGSRQI